MSVYQPLDLSAWSNPEQCTSPGRIKEPFGPQTLRGLPFDIRPVFFGDGGHRAIEIPVRASAQWVLVAHALCDRLIIEGGRPGETVATFRFEYKDSEPIVVPIRERFEIGFVPTGWDIRNWGQCPFMAEPDRYDALVGRDSGPWDHVGYRQTEVNQADAKRFYLWAWPNPHPEHELARLSIEARGRPMLVGGITLSTFAENPLHLAPRYPVKISLTDPQQADQPFKLAVNVDRGIATYPYPLPRQPREDYLADPLRGWGQERSAQNSPAYVEIAALPSATVEIKGSDENIASVTWSDVLEHGVVQTPAARIELGSTGKNWVHVTVVDDVTGQPVPCRVHFRSPDGIPYQPHGHHDHLLSDMGTWHIDVGGDLRLGSTTYAYIDGKCQGWLPLGEMLVDVARGFEVEPLRMPVQIQPGQRELTLRLKRVADMNAQGWYSGDTHGSITHHHAEADHRAFLERPFHEAIEAVRRHMQRS